VGGGWWTVVVVVVLVVVGVVDDGDGQWWMTVVMMCGRRIVSARQRKADGAKKPYCSRVARSRLVQTERFGDTAHITAEVGEDLKWGGERAVCRIDEEGE
jgi:hypothetical protein